MPRRMPPRVHGRSSRFVRALDPSYDRPVNERARSVLATALSLSLDERAEVVAELLASLDGEPDEDVEAAWAVEIERRARRVLRDGPSGPTWEEVRAELRSRS